MVPLVSVAVTIVRATQSTVKSSPAAVPLSPNPAPAVVVVDGIAKPTVSPTSNPSVADPEVAVQKVPKSKPSPGLHRQ
jgi:hypothetical protein